MTPHYAGIQMRPSNYGRGALRYGALDPTEVGLAFGLASRRPKLVGRFSDTTSLPR